MSWSRYESFGLAELNAPSSNQRLSSSPPVGDGSDLPTRIQDAPVAATAVASTSTLEERLKVVEAAFYQQTQQLRDARLTIETQKILFDRKHNKTPKGKKNNETDQEIAMTAFRSYFTFAEMVWSFATSHQLAAATIPETYDPLDRFRATPDEITQKTHAYVWLIGEVIRTKFNSLQSLELHEIFYHDLYVSSKGFRRRFQHELRTNATILLADISTLTKKDIETIVDDEGRANNPHFKALLGYVDDPPNDTRQYPIVCPIIEGPDEGTFNASIIQKVLKMVLFGPKKINNPKPKRDKRCSASIWNCHNVTIGMVALVLVGIRYVISPDCSFAIQGKKSGIPWRDDYEEYTKILASRQNDPATISFFQELDRELFGESSAPSQPARLPGHVNVAIGNASPFPVAPTTPIANDNGPIQETLGVDARRDVVPADKNKEETEVATPQSPFANAEGAKGNGPSDSETDWSDLDRLVTTNIQYIGKVSDEKSQPPVVESNSTIATEAVAMRSSTNVDKSTDVDTYVASTTRPPRQKAKKNDTTTGSQNLTTTARRKRARPQKTIDEGQDGPPTKRRKSGNESRANGNGN